LAEVWTAQAAAEQRATDGQQRHEEFSGRRPSRLPSPGRRPGKRSTRSDPKGRRPGRLSFGQFEIVLTVDIPPPTRRWNGGRNGTHDPWPRSPPRSQTAGPSALAPFSWLASQPFRLG
jgi:hypothetical protein